ncbi:MAG TPA: diguanylate cyclase [Victivallales bacterium]|nr:diguanylate cyclase [Victivallales bacterium]
MSNLLFVVCKSIEKEMNEVLKGHFNDKITVISYQSQCMKPKSQWDEITDYIAKKAFDDVFLFGCCNLLRFDLLPEALQKAKLYKLNCHEMLLDNKLINMYVEQGYFILSEGWLNSWKNTVHNVWKFDKTTAEYFFNESCSKLLFLNSGLHLDSSKHIEEFSTFINRQFEVLFIGLDHLKLYIKKLLFEYKADEIKDKLQYVTSEKNKLKSDYALMIHLLNELPNEKSEKDIIRKIINIFGMVCSSNNIFYLSQEINNKPKFYCNKLCSESQKNTIIMFLADKIKSSEILIEKDDSFIFLLRHNSILLGALYVYKIKFIRYKNDYISFIKTVISICALAIANSRKYDKLQLIQKKLCNVNKKLHQLTIIDPLTNIPNRRKFHEYLSRELNLSFRNKLPISVIMADIDYFKKYNDTYGHYCGDKCLQTIAEAIKNSLKRVSDLVGRFGGEEFIIILPNTDSSGALTVASEIQDNVRKLKIEHVSSKISKFVTLSFGVVSITPNKIFSIKDIINYADEALYEAKSEGRNKVKLCAKKRTDN